MADEKALAEIRQRLKSMNELLDEALSKYDNDEIDLKGIAKAADRLIRRKYEVLKKFPDVFGAPFNGWYGDFVSLDEKLERLVNYQHKDGVGKDDVKRALKDAKRQKEDLEKRLPK